MFDLERYQKEVIRCTKCPRLREHCRRIATQKRKAFLNQIYWGKPVPPFGDPNAELFILGLAPGAHGANRTGRQFTGDRSGEWLYRALHKTGFANQAMSSSIEDGLQLKNTMISCAVKCAPPDNKPTTQELKTCIKNYASREIYYFSHARVYVALGQIAWKTLWNLLKPSTKVEKFSHGKEIEIPDTDYSQRTRYLIASYHPSQQNTFTKTLTEPMFDAVFSRARTLLSITDSK